MKMLTKTLIALNVISCIVGGAPLMAQDNIARMDVSAFPADTDDNEFAEEQFLALSPTSHGVGARALCPVRGSYLNVNFPQNLNLSDEQYEQLFVIRKDFLNKFGPKFVEMRSLKRDLDDLLTRPELDKAKIQSVQNKLNNLKSDIANLRLERQTSMLSTLTLEQRKELRRAFVAGVRDGHGYNKWQQIRKCPPS